MNEQRQQLRNRLELLEDIRCWLLDRIDGGEETKGDDGLISDFIRKLDALSSEMGTVPAAETPITQALVSMLEAGWLSLVSSAPGAVKPLIETMERMERELIDLKQRLLPQYLGRAQRAEHERDALLEQLIEARSAMQQSYGCLWRYTGSSNPMFLQARKMLLARLTKEQQASGIRYANELFGHTTEHEILHSGCSHDAAPSATEETAIGHARYEYVRTLNPRKFAALYNEALMGVYQFDDLVDCYRDAGKR